jgi:hypothetical protein
MEVRKTQPRKTAAQPSPQRGRFKIGKYDILAQPAPGSMHMLRYTVMLNGKRLGALLSMPSESDCRFMESPPVVPPLKIFSVTFRPGRPKKGAPRPANAEEGESVTLPWAIKGQRRY